MKAKVLEVSKAATTVVLNSIKFRSDKPGFFQLALHVKPGAKQSRIAEITDDFIGVQVRSNSLSQNSPSQLDICSSQRR